MKTYYPNFTIYERRYKTAMQTVSTSFFIFLVVGSQTNGSETPPYLLHQLASPFTRQMKKLPDEAETSQSQGDVVQAEKTNHRDGDDTGCC